jgi:hypothetical protein
VLTKQRIVLLLLLLFALPAVVTTALLTQNVKLDVHDGAQPGGSVKGIVVDAEKKPLAGIDVTGVALPTEGGAMIAGRTLTDAKGAFELALSPTVGHYELRFTAPHRQEARVAFGWLDASGHKTDPVPLEVRMEAGCSLDIDVVRADGKAAGPGTFELQGAPGGGLFSSWVGAHVTRSGTFDAGTFHVDGLPPMHGRLWITMATGERIDSTLDLVVGKNHHKIEL